jgi:hypothetical protein
MNIDRFTYLRIGNFLKVLWFWYSGDCLQYFDLFVDHLDLDRCWRYGSSTIKSEKNPSKIEVPGLAELEGLYPLSELKKGPFERFRGVKILEHVIPR